MASLLFRFVVVATVLASCGIGADDGEAGTPASPTAAPPTVADVDDDVSPDAAGPTVDVDSASLPGIDDPAGPLSGVVAELVPGGPADVRWVDPDTGDILTVNAQGRYPELYTLSGRTADASGDEGLRWRMLGGAQGFRYDVEPPEPLGLWTLNGFILATVEDARAWFANYELRGPMEVVAERTVAREAVDDLQVQRVTFPPDPAESNGESWGFVVRARGGNKVVVLLVRVSGTPDEDELASTAVDAALAALTAIDISE